MKRINIINAVFIVLLCCFSLIYGADSKANPVVAAYCDGSTLDIYPYSFVTRGDGSTFNCYDVVVTSIPDGFRYGFEDKDDADYNDIVIELWVSGNGTANPIAHVKYLSKEASYLHWIHLVYGGTDSLVFKAEVASPGAVFDIPLPIRDCPDFEIEADPAGQTAAQGETTGYTVKLAALNDFTASINLSVSGLPTGATGNFTLNPVTPAPTGESILNIIVAGSTPPGTYALTITGAGGGREHSAAVNLKVVCRDFSVGIEAEPESGPTPLKVGFLAVISNSPAAIKNKQELLHKETPEGFVFKWDFGDGTTSNIQNPEHTYQAPGNFPVLLIVTDTCGSSKTAALTIKVKGFEGVITKSFSLKEAAPGDEVYINIRAENSTSYNYDNITIRDPLSPLLEYLEDDASVTPHRSGQEYIWKFPNLKKGRAISFKIKARIPEKATQGSITNTAYLSHDSLGKGKSIASNTASLLINVINVSIQKQVDLNVARPGETLKYTLTIKNNSPIPIEQIKISDEISNNLDFISASPTASFDFSRQSRKLIWQGSLEPLQQIAVAFSAKISPNCLSGTRIQNLARIEAKDLDDPLISNTVITTIHSQPVSLTKVRFTQRPDVPQTEVGRIIRFAITLSNRSAANLIAPVIEDILPQGFNYVAGTTLLNSRRFAEPQGKRRLLWQLPLVNGGETVILRFQAVIGSDASRGRSIIRAVLRAADNNGQDIFLEAPAFVNVSTSGFIFYSGVDGTVYLDRDDDDFYSMVDTPLTGIEVRLSTGEKSITDTTGRYFFESLLPGEYAVGVNTATLPEKYKLSSSFPRVVVLADGLTDTADFAIKFKREDEVKNARLEGRVFYDKNRNRVYDSGDPLCEKFKAKLDHILITNGSNGTFVFTPLESGTHSIEILYNEGVKTIKKEITINKGKNHIDIPLRYSGITIIIKGEEQ